MRPYGLPHIGLFVSQPAGEPGALSKERDFLDDPARAVSVALFLGDHPPLRVPLPCGNRDRFAAVAARADQVAGLRLGLAFLNCALEILSPQSPLAPGGQELYVVGGVIVAAELIIGPSVVRQAADEKLRGTARV